MTSEDNNKPEVRRYGQKNRKAHLESVDPFADGLQDDSTDADELARLADLASEVIGTEAEAESDTSTEPKRPVTPPEERFPPIPTDDEDESAPQAEAAASGRPPVSWRYDIITALFLLGTIMMVGYFVYVWQYPYSALNPLAPPTPFVQVTWTPDTQAIAAYHATQTATAATPVQATQPASTPTEAGLAATTPEATPPDTTLTPAPTGDVPGQPRFTLSDEGVTYERNTNDRGCQWSSIAGTVIDGNGDPIDGYRVRITDVEEPSRLDVEVFSGSSTTRGPGSFELSLSSEPQDRRYTVQLFDEDGEPVSDPFLIFTRDSCAANVAVVSFVPNSDR